MAVPDTHANRRAVPKPASGPNGEAGYPMIRLVTIVATGTRMIISAVFGTASELAYASRLLASLPADLLVLGDRNFATRDLFAVIKQTGSDFLLRAKTGRSGLKLPVEHQLADGSYLSHAGSTTVRVIDALITITTSAGTTDVDYRLVTSLLDPVEAPAARLVSLYHERWEIDIASPRVGCILKWDDAVVARRRIACPLVAVLCRPGEEVARGVCVRHGPLLRGDFQRVSPGSFLTGALDVCYVG